MKKKLLFMLAFAFATVSYSQNKQLSDELIKRNESYVLKNSERKIDRTALYRQVLQSWDDLTEEAKTYFLAQFDRPELKDEYIYYSDYFNIHYSVTDDNYAVSDADEDNNDIPDYVESVGKYLDEIYEKLSSAGYTMPPPDGDLGGDSDYDVYIADNNWGGYGYVAPDADALTYDLNIIGDNPNSEYVETDVATTYMALNNLLDDESQFTEGFKAALVSTAVHEFMHSIQFSYSSSFGTWIAESFAVWSEQTYYPEITAYEQYYDAFATPDMAINLNKDDEENPDYTYELPWYSQWPFVIYLTEKYGDKIVQEIYMEIAESSAEEGFEASYYNDYMYINDVLVEHESSIYEFYHDYLIAMGFMTKSSNFAPYVFKNANTYLKLDNLVTSYYEMDEGEIQYLGNFLEYDSSVDGDGILQRGGADYIYLSPSDEEYSIMVESEVDNSKLAAILVMYDHLGYEVIDEIAPEGSDYELFTINNPGKHGMLIVCRMDFETVDLESETYYITVGGEVSVNENSKDNVVNVFPNPVHDYATIKVNEIFENSSIIVSNTLGQVMYNTELNQLETILDFSDYPEGLYFVKYSNGSDEKTIKITHY